MKILVLGIIVVLLIFFSIGSNDGGRNASENSDNYGQYDKGTPLCDKGAYGDVNGLCD